MGLELPRWATPLKRTRSYIPYEPHDYGTDGPCGRHRMDTLVRGSVPQVRPPAAMGATPMTASLIIVLYIKNGRFPYTGSVYRNTPYFNHQIV